MPEKEREREKSPILRRGVVGGGGQAPRAQLVGHFQTKDLAKSGWRQTPLLINSDRLLGLVAFFFLKGGKSSLGSVFSL